jgi:hypothetical protein
MYNHKGWWRRTEGWVGISKYDLLAGMRVKLEKINFGREGHESVSGIYT